MALILEIRDRRGATTWHSLNQLPMTLGRALSNTVILDDPYVDAQHARIAADESGSLTVHDLGSVNGTLANGARTMTSVAVQPGIELRIGRTTLRFRDQDEAVPPAFVESSQQVPRIARWAVTARGSSALVAAVAGLTALGTWLGSSDRSNGTAVFAAVIAALVFITIWASIWAASVRGADRRFQLRAHLGVASAATLVIMLYSNLNEWLLFFFPDVWVLSVAFLAVALIVVAGVVAGHLSVAGVATPRRRWRVGFSVSAALLLLGLVGNLVAEDKFSDVPKFPAQLKPISPSLVPTHSVDDFVKAMAEARSEADKAIKR